METLEDIASELADRLTNGPRGMRTDLANSLGLQRQAVQKWTHRHTFPREEHWKGIELFFGWKAERIRLAKHGVIRYEVHGLEEVYQALKEMTAANDALLGRVERIEQWARLDQDD